MKKIMFIVFLFLSLNNAYAELIFQEVKCPDNKNALRDTCGLPESAYTNTADFNESYKIFLKDLCSNKADSYFNSFCKNVLKELPKVNKKVIYDTVFQEKLYINYEISAEKITIHLESPCSDGDYFVFTKENNKIKILKTTYSCWT